MRTNRKHLNLMRKESWMKIKDPARLKRKRINRGYSQRDLAYLVRKSQAAISLIERGEMKTITEDFALLLAARLGVDWEDYFDLEEREAVPNVHSARSVA